MDAEPEDKLNEFPKINQSMLDYIIPRDKKELTELLTELNEADLEYIDTLLKLEELIGVFLTDDFSDGKLMTPMIDYLRRKLQGSLITKSKQHSLDTLLNDVAQNRYHVQSILEWNAQLQEIFQIFWNN